jgi:hypothetical protein
MTNSNKVSIFPSSDIDGYTKNLCDRLECFFLYRRKPVDLFFLFFLFIRRLWSVASQAFVYLSQFGCGMDTICGNILVYGGPILCHP